MALDPQVKALLDGMAEAGAPPISEQSPEEARLAGAVLGQLSVPEQVASVEHRTLPGPAGDLAVRIYRPDADTPTDGAPAMVWFHGGGFVIGSLDTADGICRALCRRSGVTVLSVDYRLAPEHRFPAAPDDCLAAFDWVRQRAGELGLDADRIAVGGDSAGGNLATVTALARRGQVAFQLLVYPVTDLTMTSESYQRNAEGYLLTADAMGWFLQHYTTDAEQKHDPRVSPLFEHDLAGSAPAFIMTAEYDPLCDEGEAYGKRLVDAGVPVQVKRYDGMIHGFLQMSALVDATGPALDDAAAALRDGLA
jgi:acetyl esterase